MLMTDRTDAVLQDLPDISLVIGLPVLDTGHETALGDIRQDDVRLKLTLERMYTDAGFLIERDTENFKHHIMLIACESIAGVCPSINNAQRIDEYCRKLLPIIKNPDLYKKEIEKAYDTLQNTIKKWIRTHGTMYRHGIKDNSNFTKFLVAFIRGGNTDNVEYDTEQTLVLRGRVIKCRRDRNGFNYGFIHRQPNDVFFHERDNEELDFNEIYGKTVLYRIFPDSINGEDRAEIIEVLSE